MFLKIIFNKDKFSYMPNLTNKEQKVPVNLKMDIIVNL